MLKILFEKKCNKCKVVELEVSIELKLVKIKQVLMGAVSRKGMSENISLPRIFLIISYYLSLILRSCKNIFFLLQTWKQWNGHSMCNLTRSGPPHHAEISTYDLYAATKFDSGYGGEWEMPQPKSCEHLSFQVTLTHQLLQAIGL